METVTTYEPPEILGDMDDDVIHQNMLSNLPSNIDKTEGGFAHDFTRPAAIELAEMMISLNEVVQLFFPEWSYGTFLDMIAAGVTITRKSATAAEAILHVTGVPGTNIPAGFLFSTTATAESENIEFVVLEDATIEEKEQDNSADVKVRCTQTGIIGNVPQNSITLMSSPIGGIAVITTPEPAEGGTEDETDDELRERIKERDQQGESSFVGNNADYKRWAKEVDGVGSVIVMPEWKGAGTGTVKLIVMDSTGAPASESIQTNVYNHIMSPDNPDRRLAPIGAILTVDTATVMQLTITANITLAEGANIEGVTDGFKTALRAYFESAKDEAVEDDTGICYIRYTRVGRVLSETPGVVDYSELYINGARNNVMVAQDQYPTADNITFTEARAQ